jgi:uncharacterized membrane protein HdeD (DUF308 family)
MEDDEEFSYKGYSAKTAEHIETAKTSQTLVGDEEDYSLNNYKPDEAVADATAPINYGDFIVEKMSIGTHVKKLTRLINLSETKENYILAVLDLVIGVLCVAFSSHIGNYFSYIVGAFMALIGLGQFVFAISTKEYVYTHSNKTAVSIILMALAVMILVERESANTIIAIAWGFIGLFEGAHAFNHAFSRMARRKRFVYYLIKGLIEVVLAFLLLHDPTGHLHLHIIVFGVQLILDAITTFPPFKKFFSKR